MFNKKCLCMTVFLFVFVSTSATSNAAIVIANMVSMDMSSSSIQNGSQIDTTASGSISNYTGLAFNPIGSNVNLFVVSDLAGLITGGSFAISSGVTNYLSGVIGTGGITFVSPSNFNNPTFNFNVGNLSSTELNVFDIIGPVSVTLDLTAPAGANSITALLSQNNFTGLLDAHFEYQVTDVPLPHLLLLFVCSLLGIGAVSRCSGRLWFAC